MNPRRLPSARKGVTPFLVLAIALCVTPLVGQVDFTGLWRPLARNEDGSGMVGDTAGVPVSPGSQARVQSWSPEDFDTAEFVCRPHAWDYSLETVLTQMQFRADIDRPTQRVVAYHGHVNQMEQEVAIWMDGRPVLRPMRCTPGAAFRPANGTATSSS